MTMTIRSRLLSMILFASCCVLMEAIPFGQPSVPPGAASQAHGQEASACCGRYPDISPH